jgi:hypothetical protein
MLPPVLLEAAIDDASLFCILRFWYASVQLSSLHCFFIFSTLEGFFFGPNSQTILMVYCTL